jgi:hypothetical protein
VEPIGPRGKREEAGCPGGRGLQQGRPGHAVERVPEVQLQGHVPGAAQQARPEGAADAMATPRDADPELQGGEGRTSVLAGGLQPLKRLPLPPGYCWHDLRCQNPQTPRRLVTHPNQLTLHFCHPNPPTRDLKCWVHHCVHQSVLVHLGGLPQGPPHP